MVGDTSLMDDLPDYCTAGVLVLGCGNPLVGDDGFGPAVAEHLLRSCRPKDVCVINAGTGSRTILFNLVTGEPRPRGIIIVDALDAGRRPGELFEAPLGSLSLEKAEDFNIHMTPASNMLLQLTKMCVDVRVLACQPSPLPGKIHPGLSGQVQAAVVLAAKLVLKMASGMLSKR
jgi:coenzyme F420 hydrogenase subunit delta